MIYAAYAGTGKSYFCQENPEAIDLICMPFKYTNLSEVSGNMESDREGEQIKANPKLTLRNYWVLYYYWAIKYLLYYCPEIPLVIPTIDLILDFLEADQIPYTLIYPEKNLKDEYEKRYKNRGNTEEFLDIFIGQWEFRIEELEQRNSPLTKHIVLQEGQYLSDVISCVDGCDVYKNQQIEKFKQKLYQLQNNTLKGIIIKEEEVNPLSDDMISAVLYLKPICDDDIVTDFVWISSKRQMHKLLEQYKHDDFRTVPELILLKMCYTESGIRCKTRIERNDLCRFINQSI